MKAISLIQPWAQMLVTPHPHVMALPQVAIKGWETRSWSTTHRGTILIHASAGYPKWAKEARNKGVFVKYCRRMDLQFGKIIGKVDIELVMTTEAWREKFCQPPIALHYQEERDFGDYSDGWYAWKCVRPVWFQHPVPYKGSLSLWEFPDAMMTEEMRRACYNPFGKKVLAGRVTDEIGQTEPMNTSDEPWTVRKIQVKDLFSGLDSDK